MFRRIWARLRPAIFWSYGRGSWQYDVIVVLILGFIFLSPRSLFNDRPSAELVHEVEAFGADMRVFWFEPGVVETLGTKNSDRRLHELLREHSGEVLQILRTEPATDEAGNIRGYLVYAQR